MADSISTQLLRMIRSGLKEKNLNTASLAVGMGRTRKEIKQILSGKSPLLVDDFAQMAEILDLEKTLLSSQNIPKSAPEEDTTQDFQTLKTPELENEPSAVEIDPYGNHAEQILFFAFQLGIDVLLMLDTNQLGQSNIPTQVINQFQTRLPVRLDAIFHDKMKLRFHELAFEILLSFDGLYECIIPWSAVEQVVLFPIIEDPDASDEGDIDTAPPHLRLV